MMKEMILSEEEKLVFRSLLDPRFPVGIRSVEKVQKETELHLAVLADVMVQNRSIIQTDGKRMILTDPFVFARNYGQIYPEMFLGVQR